MSHKVGPLGEEEDGVVAYSKRVLARASRAFSRRKRETPKLSGNRETRTLTGYPNYSCGLIRQEAASEMGGRADGSSYENKDARSHPSSPGSSQDC